MKNLWNECQNEVTHAGEYHTYEALDDMKIGDSIVLDDTDDTVGKIIRIW